MRRVIEDTASEDERLADLERYAVLADPPHEQLQGLVELVAHLCDVRTAAINIVSRTEQHAIAATGVDPAVCAREDSMCGLVLTDHDTVVVPDASRDARFRDNDFVDGTRAAVRFYASAPLVTPEGTVLGRLCVFDGEPRTLTPRQQRALRTLADQVMDVLELRHRGRELEDSLRELTAVRDELRRSNEHLAQFAGQVSHDLRSPLTAILANAEMLAHEPVVEVDEQLGSMVKSVSAAGHRMNRMIEEMLGLALEGGRLSVAPTPVSDVVALALADLEPTIAQHGAQITVEELPTLSADPDMLYSIVLNLLTNALKFTRDGVAPEVHVWAQERGARWRIGVDDNGPGIAEQDRERVFRPFERADGDAPGHGIGLATIHRLVHAHGGDCGADTSPSGGASVWFELRP